MRNGLHDIGIDVFSTFPAATDCDRREYIRRVTQVSQWSEEAGCVGALVYTDNRLVDPWLVSHIVVQNTKTFCPLVAVQPVYMHPYTVAKIIASFGYLYGRRIYLNMVAGGFKNDLSALDDTTPHHKRYDRLVEYTTIIKQLLYNSGPVTFDGEFYKVRKLTLTPPLPRELFPGLLLSGSSEAGLTAARALEAVAIEYPKPPNEDENEPRLAAVAHGIRVGIIARQDEDEAWSTAYQRFPVDRKGALTHQLAIKVSDSVWHKQLSQMSDETNERTSPYWLVPFENYKTFCPYLVGSYQRVADELARYIALGHRTVILDVPPSLEELYHTNVAFGLAAKKVGLLS